MRAALLLAALALAAAGCEVLAPVVGEHPLPGTGETPTCDPSVTCARLTEPPPDTLDETTLAAPDDACRDNWTSEALTMREDLTLDADALPCVDLVVTALPSAEPDDGRLRTLTLAGAALRTARVRLTSSATLVRLRVAAGDITDTTLRADGAVRLDLQGARAERVEIVLGGSEPIDPPELLVVGGSLGNVRITGLRSAVRLQDVRVGYSAITARAITLERGRVADALLGAELVELLDVDVTSTRFDAERMIVSGGRVARSHVARCGSLTLAATQVLSSFVAACSEPADLETASIGGSVLAGDLRGSHPLLTRSVLGGGSVHVVDGILSDVALCGTSTLRAASLTCGRCEPSAPSEVCLDYFERVTECPGLCRATCADGLPPRLVDTNACAE